MDFAMMLEEMGYRITRLNELAEWLMEGRDPEIGEMIISILRDE